MKLVDIQYNLDGNRSMFVEFFFSHDGGVTFPVSCTAVTGDAGPFVEYGIGKTAVWDAAQDWDQQFTSQGRIMIKATYGDQPTGFPYLDQNGTNPNDNNNTSPNNDPAVDFVTVEIPFPASSGPVGSPTHALRENYQRELIALGEIPGYPTKFHVDKYEVTVAKWNEVVSWAEQNGYDLNLASGSLNSAILPGGTIEFAKWLNARSEMEGLTPVFYVEMREYRFDENGDGQFQPNEFIDLNENGIWDAGLITVFRNGTIALPPRTDPISGTPTIQGLLEHTKFSANGYRLPDSSMIMPEAAYFALGGRTEMDIGGNYAAEWPWGGDDQNPNDSWAVVPPNGEIENPDSIVGTKQPNGFGLYDMIGNVAETSLDSIIDSPSSYGGSKFSPPNPASDWSMGGGELVGPDLWMYRNSLPPHGFRSLRLEF